MSSVKAGSITKAFGDVETIEVPDPNQFDEFVEVGTIKGAEERTTVTLTGRYARDIKSELLKMANKKCAVDVQVNLGACTDPSDYNTFQKKLILEDARLTSWNTEDIGALASDERASVDESVDISAAAVYEIVQLSFSSRALDIVTNEVIDVVICDTQSCGDCEDESTGYDKIFALTVTAGGSPSTPSDVVFSIDGGTTWYAHDIETLTTSEADALGCLGAYLFAVSDATESAHYALKSEFDGPTDPVFTEVTTGFVSGGGPLAVDTGVSKAFIVGTGGYIYSSDDITSGVTVLDAGAVYTDNYLAVSAFSDEFAVAVGVNGRIVKTENGTNWAAVTPSPVAVGINLNAILVISKTHWIIGTSDGNIWYTVNGGTTWTAKTFSGSGSGVVRDIVMSTESVLYLSHDTTTPRGRILRSSNGGYDWVVLPEGSGVLPASDQINALAASAHNSDFIVGVGLADDGSDGYIVVGTE
jgi:photosystem II stability/assembly factor-like uncharacterized protein